MARRSIAVCCGLALLLALSACGNEPTPVPVPSSAAPSSGREEPPESVLAWDEIFPDSKSNPLEPLDFYEFRRQVNNRRKAGMQGTEKIDIASYTTASGGQQALFTQAEMDVLFTPHGMQAGGLTQKDAAEDVETFFKLLKTTYGAYGYFGGDERFLPIRDKVLDRLSKEERILSKTLEDTLAEELAPVLVDGHFTIGSTAMREEHNQFMYYVPGLYFTDLQGLFMDYVKPTIGPDGGIVYWFAALSRDGKDLPSQVMLSGKETALKWQQAGSLEYHGEPIFEQTEFQGIPLLISRQMMADNDRQKQRLEEFASCGGAYRDKPLYILDARCNPGGSDEWAYGWFQGLTGSEPEYRTAFGQNYSQMYRELNRRNPYDIGDWSGWRVNSSLGSWVENQNTVFMLTDKGSASSGETFIKSMRTVDNVLFVGGNTLGCSLVPNNFTVYLPRSGVECYFGTGLWLVESSANLDGIGFLPDLWVEPTDALEAVGRLCAYYGLAE